jgi:hypothetical protein
MARSKRGVVAGDRELARRSAGRRCDGQPFLTARAAVVVVLAGSLALAGPAAAGSRSSSGGTASAPPGFVLDSVTAVRAARPAYRVDILFPRVTGLSKPVVARINARIDTFVRHTVAGFEGEVLAGRPPYPPGQEVSTLVGSVTTEFDSDRIVAVSLAEYTFPAGAAHGTTAVTTFNFDAGTGDAYRLADLFAPSSGWLARLSRASRHALPRLVGSLSSTHWIDSGTMPLAANFSAWSLTPWGLEITFGEYQVAPYAAGMPQVTIPYASLAASAAKAGPLPSAAAGAGAATTGPGRMALLPAVSQPVPDECYAAVSYRAGLPRPFTCSGGRINVAAWNSFTQYFDGAGLAGLRLLRLAGSPSVDIVRATMCEDLGPGPYTDAATVVAAEQLVADYHDWRFKRPPSTGFPGYCHEVGS